jgi:hypothetical protein
MASTGTIVNRMYSGFRGVDFRGEDVNLVRSPDSLNMWKNYTEIDSIRTRPAMENLHNIGAKINGLYSYNGQMLVHSGTKLYKVNREATVELYSGLLNEKSNGFVFGDLFYIKDSETYLVYNGTTVSEVVGYIPTTTIGRRPSGGGTKHEDVNMLTSIRINTFLADGKSTNFYLDTRNIDADYTPIVKVNGTATTASGSEYTVTSVNYTDGYIVFSKAPPKPLTDGQDNVSIQFQKSHSYAERIRGCKLIQTFDNRVFFSGNPKYPSTVWHTSLNDVTYVSDLDYYNEGTDKANITGMVAGNNSLWVFREPSDENANVFYHTPALDDEYGKIYPSSHSSVSLGCTGKAINFNDDIVFFSPRGMEGINGDITTEQFVAHRSTMVDRKLIAEADYSNMLLEEWEGYLMVFIGNKVYLADSRAIFTNENHIEYEWFYWELEKNITCTRVQDGILYLGTDDGGVYTLTDNESDVDSYWVTPKDKFGTPHKLKTTNKKGCVVEATGDISVSAKTDNDTEFDVVGEYTEIRDFFASRIKKKKFKDIQLKFHSAKRFSLESATLECVVGGYIKGR